MAFDEGVADLVRSSLSEAGVPFDERRMFGGLAFMVGGHMTVGVVEDDLVVRVGEEAHDEAVRQPGAREMDLTGRPSTGMVFVTAAALDEAAMDAWVGRALAFTRTLPSRS